MHEEADADHRQDDQTKRQFQDRRSVLQQLLIWDAPTVEEQQGRDEEKEENLRIELDAQIGDKADYPAQDDLDQRPGDRQRQHPRYEAAHDHRHQENKNNCNGFQRRALLLLSLS